MPISPQERRRRLQARNQRRNGQRPVPAGRRPNPNPAVQNPQNPQQPQMQRLAHTNKDIFWNIERLIQLLIMSAVYGAFVCGACFGGSLVFNSFLLQSLGKAIATAATGYAQMILPAVLLPYAGAIIIGIPLAITAYHVVSAALTGTLFAQGKEEQGSSALHLISLAAPFAMFALGPIIGPMLGPLSFATFGTYVATGLTAAIGTLLLSEFPQEAWMLKTRISQRREGTPQPNPNQRNSRRRPGQNPAPTPDADNDDEPEQQPENTRRRGRGANPPARNTDTPPAANTRSRTAHQPPATPARRETPARRYGGGTTTQFQRARGQQAADAAQQRATRQNQRGQIHTTTRRNPVAEPVHEGPRRSERLRNH